ncbi:MAG: hypothetical protein J0L55_02000 [Caulobacterales bacterium]|nr:hypothetical protein [Caulobacterales bacterium]MCA0371818.1 ATP-sensitive inward rectifier potassium channel 10 [Pseudomonadota bacterium]
MSDITEQKPKRLRLVSRDAGFRVIPIGKSKNIFGDLYARLLSGSWKSIIFIIVCVFFALNLIFATLYYLDLGEIANARVGHFNDAFFFSVQTLATIGYGAMSPQGLWPNILVTIESMLGFAYYGLVTGLMFAKFSSPSARILFSEVAIIRNYQGVPHLMFRLVNERENRIVNAKVKATILKVETINDETSMRRFHDIELVRSEMPFLQLTWLVLHKIDENSPLFGMTPEDLEDKESEIVVSITGHDETFSQSVHARNSYIADEIRFNEKFVDILNRRDDYVVEVHYDKLSETIPE